MRTRWFVVCAALLVTLGTITGCSNAMPSAPTPDPTPSTQTVDMPTSGDFLTISYLDVGQGDSILIQAPGGKTMLIDAGDTDQGQAVANYLTRKGVSRIDVLIATHPKQSHIGGMPYIVEHFDIGTFYIPDTALTNAAQSLALVLQAVDTKGIPTIAARAGLSIDLGEGLTVCMIAPVRQDYTSSNDFSAVIRIQYGQTSFLFTGDATEVSERDMLNAQTDVSADVLKIGHHGEATSSSPAFLQAVSPTVAIISVGADNWYGHPEPATLDRLNRLGIKVYRTDRVGTVVIQSDGSHYEITTDTGDS